MNSLVLCVFISAGFVLITMLSDKVTNAAPTRILMRSDYSVLTTLGRNQMNPYQSMFRNVSWKCEIKYWRTHRDRKKNMKPHSHERANRIDNCTKGNAKTFWRQFINIQTILLYVCTLCCRLFSATCALFFIHIFSIYLLV